MCGIIGVVGREPSLDAVASAVDRLGHRGPDARAHRLLDGDGARCAMGQTRLRIIDLSAEADQPLANEDEAVWVVFNGELYNHGELRTELCRKGHRFRSRSDTEVLVHLYEDADGDAHRMLERLRGMFAFAIFDTRRGSLLLARDRLGIKPLYIAPVASGLAFASEVRALAATGLVSARPDAASVMGYLAWGVVPGPRTILEGVEELPAGSYLEWSAGGSRREVWWTARPDPVDFAREDAEILLRGALQDAVERHLVADRPVGLFLSSGTDSGAVATLAARRGAVRALTVAFPDDDAGDELDEAAGLARALGLDHVIVPARGADVAAELPRVLTAMDQPTSDGVNTWVVCRAAREAGLVVALSGLGGDEIFGGYSTFRRVPAVRLVLGVLRPVPRSVRGLAARRASARRPGGRIARLLDAPAGDSGAYFAVRGLLGANEVDGPRGGLPWSEALRPQAHEESPRSDSADRVMLAELEHYLADQLLRDTDQMSMAHSLEVRVPLLDDHVVAAALALPSRVRNAGSKDLLRRAAGLDRHVPKRPFSLPFEHWLRGPLRAEVRDALLSEELPFRDEVPRALRVRLWERLEAGRVHWSRPWAVAVLRRWPEANGFQW